MRQMAESEIPAFVRDVLEAGGGIVAIGRYGYHLGDVYALSADVMHKVDTVCAAYGSRIHLFEQITYYLRSIGRRVESWNGIRREYPVQRAE